MRAIFGLVLLVGIALAGGAVYMARDYVGAYQAALEQERAARGKVVPTVQVMVAKRQLRYGETLTRDAVRAIAWPENAVPKGSFTDMAALFPEGRDKDRVVLRAMEPDEAIMALKVTAPGEDAGITSRLAKGMRAFAIRVDVASGVSGFLRPGDKVDVYWTGGINNAIEGARGEVTRLILPAVELIAIDQVAGRDVEGTMIARTVTVTANPEQVAALAQAQTTGRLSLALVGAADDTVASVIEVNQRKLLGLGDVQRAPEKVKKQVCTVRTRRGAEVVDIPIPCRK